jgi:hypothetical protein
VPASPEKPERCLNCDASLLGPWCQSCGQPARDVRRPIWALLRDFVHETFDIDGRFTRSRGPFFLRPGQLTLAYNEGRRFRYISPVRLFLFASLLFFVVSSPACPLGPADEPLPVPRPGDFQEEGGPIESRVGGFTVSGRPDRPTTEHCPLADEGSLVVQRGPDVVRLWLNDTPESDPEYWVVTRNRPAQSWKTQVGLRAQAFMERALSRDPRFKDQFAEAAMQNTARVVFLLVPLYALFLKLFVRRPPRMYVEHLVMSLHVHAFVFVAFTAITLISPYEAAYAPISQLLFLGLVVYVVAAFRRAYVSTTTRALLRAVAVFLAYVCVLVPVMLAVLFVSMITTG